jgi:hypothetical protein
MGGQERPREEPMALRPSGWNGRQTPLIVAGRKVE